MNQQDEADPRRNGTVLFVKSAHLLFGGSQGIGLNYLRQLSVPSPILTKHIVAKITLHHRRHSTGVAVLGGRRLGLFRG